jgi:hypothetical protein
MTLQAIESSGISARAGAGSTAPHNKRGASMSIVTRVTVSSGPRVSN